MVLFHLKSDDQSRIDKIAGPDRVIHLGHLESVSPKNRRALPQLPLAASSRVFDGFILITNVGNYLMENNVDFDALAQKFFAARGEDTYCDLFGAVFGLERWHFIADGEPPNFSPYCAIFPGFMEDQPVVLAFTDTERLDKYVKSKNLKIGSADRPVILSSPESTVKFSSEDLILSIPTTGVVDYLERLTEKGVKWIVFNQNKDSVGFHLGLAQLRETKELVDSKNPKIKAETKAENANESPAKTDFDALSRRSNGSGGAMDDLNDLFGATFALEKWLFIARGEMPNVNPYVAANADYAGGQQMIRAFTDADRLQRFAKENNLTDAEGAAQMLEIPVGGVVEYLEQFIPYDVHGVWFNSDTSSDGYFIPLKQLRPIKEHLAKIGWRSINETASPALPHSPGVVAAPDQNRSTTQPTPQAPPPSNLENWGVSQTPEGEPDLRIKISKSGSVNFGSSLVPLYSAFAPLLADYQGSGEFEKIFNFAAEAISNFKESFVPNDHGNYFRMQTFQYAAPNATADAMTIDSNQLRHIQTGATLLVSFALLNIPATSTATLYFGFEGGSSEVQKLLKAVTPALEAAGFVDAQTESNSPAQSADDDKNAGDYIDWFRRGTIKPDTSFKPFFQAIAPLLADYAGEGEFEFSFATGSDEPGMRDLFEDVSSNSHGAYLKYRSYIFEPYEMEMIGSNRLTSVRTGEKLRIQLTIHRNLADQKATLIVVFVGRSATVETLENAVKSALDGAEYKVQLQTKKAATTEKLRSIGVQG
jgi:hypothetical protein